MCPSPGQVQGQDLQAQLAPVPSLGTEGQGVMVDGPWELKVMEKQLVFHGRVVLAPSLFYGV